MAPQQIKTSDPVTSNRNGENNRTDETNKMKIYTGRDRSPPNNIGIIQPQITTVVDTANSIGRSLRDTSPRLTGQNQKVDPRVFTYFQGRLNPNLKK